jgi:hypothetical protein
MEDYESQKDVLSKALDRLKGREGLSGPPEEVVRETLAKLAEVSDTGERRPAVLRLWPLARLAIAAAVLIAAGYAFGRASSPKPVDMGQLRATLEPALRESILSEATRDRQQALLAAYIQIKNDLTEQYRADLNRFAVQTFTASNTVTNRLLEELVQSVQASRLQDLQRVSEALGQIDAQRAQDSRQLGTAMIGLAASTETELQRTKADVVKLLAYEQPDAPASTQRPRQPSETKE